MIGGNGWVSHPPGSCRTPCCPFGTQGGRGSTSWLTFSLLHVEDAASLAANAAVAVSTVVAVEDAFAAFTAQPLRNVLFLWRLRLLCLHGLPSDVASSPTLRTRRRGCGKSLANRCGGGSSILLPGRARQLMRGEYLQQSSQARLLASLRFS